MASPRHNLPVDIFTDLLQLLLCVSTASALIVERLCLYGASYQDNRVLHGLLHVCYVITHKFVEKSYSNTKVCLLLFLPQCVGRSKIKLLIYGSYTPGNN